MELGDLRFESNWVHFFITVAILAIMELGDLLSCYTLEDFNINVAILAIMELGDLLKPTETTAAPIARRNPRYNGIG